MLRQLRAGVTCLRQAACRAWPVLRERFTAPAFLVRPVWARDLVVKVRYGGWLPQPLAEGQGVRREAESEGSRRQSPDPRDTNRIGGYLDRARRPDTSKPDATKGPGSQCGGCMG